MAHCQTSLQEHADCTSDTQKLNADLMRQLLSALEQSRDAERLARALIVSKHDQEELEATVATLMEKYTLQ